MTARRYTHDGREVEAMRFVGNGPAVAAWAGGFGKAEGSGLMGLLRVGGRLVETGDWVIRDGSIVAIVPQEVFAARYSGVRHADIE